MSHKERIRESLSQPLTAEYLASKTRDGWRPVAIEWERDAEATTEGIRTAVPFGLKVADDGRHLTVAETEMDILRLILAQISTDRPFSAVASELNRRGYRQRGGKTWSQSAVFELLPRLIDVAPEIYASGAWRQERDHLQEAAG